MKAPWSDAELARALVAGEPDAPGVAWDRYAPLVRGLLRRSLGPAAEVDDGVQEAFIRFFRSVKRLRQPEQLRSFLIGVTVRVAAGALRQRRLRSWLLLSATGAVPEPAADSVDEEGREALRRLYAILDDLGTAARLAFVLRHVENLPLDEVAAALGVSLATAKRRLAKATALVVARVQRDPVLSAYGPATRPDPKEDDDAG